ncbi:MAG: hypothetical protein HWE23_01490 [Rhodobacteraceae bacterium]|nr:hypothetical protein [Paracoccaceae bacterium]
MFSAFLSTRSFAQSSLIQQEEVGWVADVRAMRHFTGLRCPDIVANYFRTKVLASDSNRMAGCVYAGPDGITLVLRQHQPGTAADVGEVFLKTFQAAGFERVTGEGAAASGISFNTRPWLPVNLHETLWYISGAKADYTIWMNYRFPLQQEELSPALTAFTSVLSLQN